MSEEATAPVEANVEADPILTNDNTDVNPDAPLIPKGDYAMQVAKVEEKTNPDTKRKTLAIQLKTTEAVTAVNGENINPGTYFFGRIAITPSEKLSVEEIRRRLKKFQLACGIKSGPIYPLDQYKDMLVKVQIGFSKKTEDYPDERNEVKGFVVPK